MILLAATILTIMLSIYAANYCLLALISLRVRKKILKTPSLKKWPKVSIHLPLYNEGNVASRLLESCVNLDYPKNKLEIFIIDDSSDETKNIVDIYGNKYPELISVIHRKFRKGYKAGALQLALEKSTGDFIAIFDADYMPPKNFLKKMIPFFYNNDKIAFVQARCSYLNKNLSWVTKGISLGMDGYSLIDQRARHSTNLLAHFSGTGGVFRKEAIREAGGWQSDTLAEDLDLSMRLQLNGWKYTYLPNISVPGEIPPKLTMFMEQQYRWSKGFTQCFLKHWKKVICSKKLSLFQKFEALIQLGIYFVYPFSFVGLLCSLLLLLAFPVDFFFNDYWKLVFAPVISLSSAMIYFSPFFFYGTTISELNKWDKKESTDFTNILFLLIIGPTTLIANTKGILEALTQKRSPFNRTFKFGFMDN